MPWYFVPYSISITLLLIFMSFIFTGWNTKWTSEWWAKKVKHFPECTTTKERASSQLYQLGIRDRWDVIMVVCKWPITGHGYNQTKPNLASRSLMLLGVTKWALVLEHMIWRWDTKFRKQQYKGGHKCECLSNIENTHNLETHIYDCQGTYE